jgi:hypothetical protein
MEGNEQLMKAIGSAMLKRLEGLAATQAAVGCYPALREQLAKDAFGVGYAESLALPEETQERMLDQWIARRCSRLRNRLHARLRD